MIMDVTWNPSNAMQVDSDDSWIDHNRLVKTDVYEITGRIVSIVPVTKKGGDLGRVVRKMISKLQQFDQHKSRISYLGNSFRQLICSVCT